MKGPTFGSHPASAGTLDGFCEWMHADDVPDGRRITFLDPEILIDMNGEEIETHVKLKLAISRGLGSRSRIWT